MSIPFLESRPARPARPADGGRRVVPIPASVQARLDVLASTRGTRAAYLDAASGQTLTWAAIARQVADWAACLPPGTVVALRIASPAAFSRAYLAGLAAGVCVAPVDPRASADELARALGVLEAADVVVGREDDADLLAGSGATVWLSSARGLRQLRSGRDTRLPAPGVAAVLPTSGTTGRPKLVPLSQPQLLRVAAGIAGHHALTPAERGYCPLPLFHVNAQVVGLLSTLVAGCSLVVDDRFHASRFWAAAGEFSATWVNLVPAILGILAELPPPPDAVAERVRFARSASAPLPVPVHERFEAKTGIGVLETYGMTEAASQITASPLRAADRQPGSAGRPAGVRVRITGADGGELPAGETGTVEIRGRNVIHGYLGPGRTPVPARSGDGWLSTGDLARQDARGFLYLAGRSNDVINRGGEKFHPREIEEVLLADPRVRNAVVVGRPHRLLGEEPVAYVVADSGFDHGELLARCERVLSPYKRPADVVVVDALPAGPTGKLDRRALRASLNPA
ncbi:MAG TPA: AMP-binding protein [Streptosporangiaceae bacterium]